MSVNNIEWVPPQRKIMKRKPNKLPGTDSYECYNTFLHKDVISHGCVNYCNVVTDRVNVTPTATRGIHFK